MSQSTPYFLRLAMLVVICLLATTGTSHAQRLHAILVADTWSNIGKSCEADLDKLEKTLKDGLPNGRLLVTKITGADVRKDNILRTARELVIQPNDSVLFYYSGHGAYDPEEGHYLDLTGAERRSVLRSEVITALTKPATPRFWVLMTDCCAGVSSLQKTAVYGRTNSTTLLTNLFFNTTGSIDITSSRPEQVSYCNVFTPMFCEVLHNNATKALKWDEVFSQARRATASLGEAVIPRLDEENKHYSRELLQQTQIPYSFDTMYNQNVNGYRLGVTFSELTVGPVMAESAASKAGLRSGMQILRINGDRVSGDSHAKLAVEFSPRSMTINVYDPAIGSTRELTVKLPY